MPNTTPIRKTRPGSWSKNSLKHGDGVGFRPARCRTAACRRRGSTNWIAASHGPVSRSGTSSAFQSERSLVEPGATSSESPHSVSSRRLETLGEPEYRPGDSINPRDSVPGICSTQRKGCRQFFCEDLPHPIRQIGSRTQQEPGQSIA